MFLPFQNQDLIMAKERDNLCFIICVIFKSLNTRIYFKIRKQTNG